MIRSHFSSICNSLNKFSPVLHGGNNSRCTGDIGLHEQPCLLQRQHLIFPRKFSILPCHEKTCLKVGK